VTPLLTVQDLVVRFPGRRGTSTTVIDGVSFDLEAGTTETPILHVHEFAPCSCDM